MDNYYNGLKAVIYGVFAYLGLSVDFAIALSWLMLTDTLLGIVKAIRLGKKFSFYVLLWGAVSKMLLLLIPIILALGAKGMDKDFTYLVNATIGVLLCSEIVSCYTNIQSIRLKEEIPNTDFVTTLLNALRMAIEHVIAKFISIIKSKK